jgi:hypothetical protein
MRKGQTTLSKVSPSRPVARFVRVAIIVSFIAVPCLIYLLITGHIALSG